MSPRMPVVSGKQMVAVLERAGYVATRQKGSHVRMRPKPGTVGKPVTVPLHRELRPGLLRAILRDAGLSPDTLHDLVR